MRAGGDWARDQVVPRGPYHECLLKTKLSGKISVFF